MDSSNSSMGFVGNTKTNPNTKQCSPSKHWCFTFNNYKESDFVLISSNSSSNEGIEKIVFQEEIGENGTEHLQGYLAFNKKSRPSVLGWAKEIHWEKCRSPKHSIAYCSDIEKRKEGGRLYKKNVIIPKKLKIISELYQWQKNIIDIISNEPDDRKIYWFYEETGNVGKSALCKYIVHHHQGLICSGKASDMKYMIVKYIEKHGVPPECIVFDIPRTANQFISWTGIEEIKNGLFASSKYECEMVVMNSPHVIIFSNEEPNMNVVSRDRWVIKNLGEDMLIN